MNEEKPAPRYQEAEAWGPDEVSDLSDEGPLGARCEPGKVMGRIRTVKGKGKKGANGERVR